MKFESYHFVLISVLLVSAISIFSLISLDNIRLTGMAVACPPGSTVGKVINPGSECCAQTCSMPVDPSTGRGCSADYTCAPGMTCNFASGMTFSGSCSGTPTPDVCGNGVIGYGEKCDTTSQDFSRCTILENQKLVGCSQDCKSCVVTNKNNCGDGVVKNPNDYDDMEQCDPSGSACTLNSKQGLCDDNCMCDISASQAAQIPTVIIEAAIALNAPLTRTGGYDIRLIDYGISSNTLNAFPNNIVFSINSNPQTTLTNVKLVDETGKILSSVPQISGSGNIQLIYTPALFSIGPNNNKRIYIVADAPVAQLTTLTVNLIVSAQSGLNVEISRGKTATINIQPALQQTTQPTPPAQSAISFRAHILPIQPAGSNIEIAKFAFEAINPPAGTRSVLVNNVGLRISPTSGLSNLRVYYEDTLLTSQPSPTSTININTNFYVPDSRLTYLHVIADVAAAENYNIELTNFGGKPPAGTISTIGIQPATQSTSSAQHTISVSPQYVPSQLEGSKNIDMAIFSLQLINPSSGTTNVGINSIGLRISPTSGLSNLKIYYEDTLLASKPLPTSTINIVISSNIPASRPSYLRIMADTSTIGAYDIELTDFGGKSLTGATKSTITIQKATQSTTQTPSTGTSDCRTVNGEIYYKNKFVNTQYLCQANTLYETYCSPTILPKSSQMSTYANLINDQSICYIYSPGEQYCYFTYVGQKIIDCASQGKICASDKGCVGAAGSTTTSSQPTTMTTSAQGCSQIFGDFYSRYSVKYKFTENNQWLNNPTKEPTRITFFYPGPEVTSFNYQNLKVKVLSNNNLLAEYPAEGSFQDATKPKTLTAGVGGVTTKIDSLPSSVLQFQLVTNNNEICSDLVTVNIQFKQQTTTSQVVPASQQGASASNPCPGGRVMSDPDKGIITAKNCRNDNVGFFGDTIYIGNSPISAPGALNYCKDSNTINQFFCGYKTNDVSSICSRDISCASLGEQCVNKNYQGSNYGVCAAASMSSSTQPSSSIPSQTPQQTTQPTIRTQTALPQTRTVASRPSQTTAPSPAQKEIIPFLSSTQRSIGEEMPSIAPESLSELQILKTVKFGEEVIIKFKGDLNKKSMPIKVKSDKYGAKIIHALPKGEGIFELRLTPIKKRGIK